MPDRQHERWNFTEFSNATPESVCEGYCLLSGYVASELFGFRIPADCFCHLSYNPRSNDSLTRFRYEQSVYDFILSAVNDKIEKETVKQMWKPGSIMALGKGCKCPDMENRDREQGTGWAVDTECPLHGFNGSHAIVYDVKA